MNPSAAAPTLPHRAADALPIELSIVMPCLNEAETLGTCIEKANSFLQRSGVSGEVIVADNGSTDGSQEIAQRLGARVIDIHERGYGSALQGGIAAARGRFLIMGDSDDSYDFSELSSFVERLRAGDDLVMGNRFRGGIMRKAMPPLHRYFGNPVMTAIGRLFFRSPVGDFWCGLRGFSREAVDRMQLRTTGMEFALEMVVKATLLRLRVGEVPITLSPDGRSRPPHLRSWRDGWRGLRFLLLYSPRWLFFYPGILLMLGGMVAGGMLLNSPRPHSLIYAASAVMIGYQAVLFAFFAKMFASGAGLLPPDDRIVRLSRYVSLETGIIAGVLMTLAGIAGSVYAFWIWKAASFGDLAPVEMLRLIVPCVTFMTIGVETILSSFFLSVLALARK